MTTEPRDDRRDWLKTGIHFVVGAVLGALVGVLVVMRLRWSRPGWVTLLLVSGLSLVTGVLAAVYLDEFWDAVRDAFAEIKWWR